MFLMNAVTKRPLALADLAEIWSFIADDSEANADRFLSKLEAKLQLLATQAHMGRLREELMPGCAAFRMPATWSSSCPSAMASRSCVWCTAPATSWQTTSGHKAWLEAAGHRAAVMSAGDKPGRQ